MKLIAVLTFTILVTVQQSYGQQPTDNKKEIGLLIKKYAKSIIDKDSATFYNLFNDGPVTWCAAFKDISYNRIIQKNPNARSNYFSGSYKGFFKAVLGNKNIEDKFDNVQIIEDGTVASVTMDYSFWSDNKMQNWGGKYLSLIKRDGKWKITSVIYSVELSNYLEQPALEERHKRSLPGTIE